MANGSGSWWTDGKPLAYVSACPTPADAINTLVEIAEGKSPFPLIPPKNEEQRRQNQRWMHLKFWQHQDVFGPLTRRRLSKATQVIQDYDES